MRTKLTYSPSDVSNLVLQEVLRASRLLFRRVRLRETPVNQALFLNNASEARFFSGSKVQF